MTKPSSQWTTTSVAGVNLPHRPPRLPHLLPPRLFPSLAPPFRATPTPLHLHHSPSTLLHPRLTPPRLTSIATTTLSTTSSTTAPRSANRWRGSGSKGATPSWCTGRSLGCTRHPRTCSRGCTSRLLACSGRSAAGHLKRGQSTVSWEVLSRSGMGADMTGAGRKVVCT